MHLFDLPKIDSHCHVFDPAQFAYGEDIAYHPAGQELGTAHYFTHVLQAYGVRHALLVGPNSGYGLDNRCMLDAIARGAGRFKGIAVLPHDTNQDELRRLQDAGIVGAAFNVALHGTDYYADIAPLLQRLAMLGMWAQIQVTKDQLPALLPMIRDSGVQVLIDHCGRPDLRDGPDSPGQRALEELAADGKSVIKLSGFAKFSNEAYPFEDARTHAQRMHALFGTDRCLWASDWPFLRAPYRMDYGTLIQLAARWFRPDDLQKMMWDNPLRCFQFDTNQNTMDLSGL
jgi:predicted TIM-barrel fold metal-dependent hydrolase